MLGGCTPQEESSLPFELPEGFPAPAVPAESPLTVDTIELGRYLFYDVRLSGNGTQSCGTCHEQDLAFTDGKGVGEGSTGELHARNVNSLVNVAYNSSLTWANPLLIDLETQILLPLFGDSPVEMGASPGEEDVLADLLADPLYPPLFAAAYPGQDPDWDLTVKAIGSFSRSLISGNSPFDQYSFQGAAGALSASELRGMSLFYSETLECHHCHGGFNFSEASTQADAAFDSRLFHNTGLYDVDLAGAYPTGNTGLFELTNDPNDMGRFRPPTLRNVAVTAPYLHDGSAETLDEVIRIYEAGGRVIEDGPNAGDGRYSPLKSGLVAGFTLTDGQREDLIAFLGALTDESFLTDPRFADPFIP